MAEYDALPDIGHACGHNIICASSVAAARLLAPLATELGLTIKLLGTPFEEGGGGKVFMLERGVFDGLHIAMMHPTPHDDVADPHLTAAAHLSVEYAGRASHAAAAAHKGINAADAFTVAQVAPTGDKAVLDGSLAIAWTVVDLATSAQQRHRLLERNKLSR